MASSMQAVGQHPENDWKVNECVVHDPMGEHCPAPYTHRDWEYRDDFDLSDWEEGHDYEPWGTDSGFVTLSLPTRPSTPGLSTDHHYGCEKWHCESESGQDENQGLADDCPSTRLQTPRTSISADSEIDRATGSSSHNSTTPTRLHLNFSSEPDHSGTVKPLQDEDISTNPIDNAGIIPPMHTPPSTPTVEGSPTPSMEEQAVNLHRALMAISQDYHEACGSSTPTEPASEVNDPTGSPTPRPVLGRCKASINSSNSVYLAPPIPVLYYKHDSPSCWSILFNLLTEPFHRIRARKRSVRESAAMDRELRELHAQMRETEMRVKQGGVQPPQYGDLRKFDGDGGAAMQQTRGFRASGDAR